MNKISKIIGLFILMVALVTFGAIATLVGGQIFLNNKEKTFADNPVTHEQRVEETVKQYRLEKFYGFYQKEMKPYVDEFGKQLGHQPDE